MNTKQLNRRQSCWTQELAGYDFKIYFRPGKQNAKADYLSRRPEHRPEKGGDSGTILKPKNIGGILPSSRQPLPPISEADEGLQFVASSRQIAAKTRVNWKKEFLTKVKQAAQEDQQYMNGKQQINENPDSKPQMSEEEGLLY